MPQVIFYQLTSSDNGVAGRASEVIASALLISRKLAFCVTHSRKLKKLMNCYGSCRPTALCLITFMVKGHNRERRWKFVGGQSR